jgi:hypothetical protein
LIGYTSHLHAIVARNTNILSQTIGIATGQLQV